MGNCGVEVEMEKNHEFFCTKDNYSHLFEVVVILTNFLHKCHFNFTYKVMSDPIDDLIDYGWDGDF